jgi:hypothetical protein
VARDVSRKVGDSFFPELLDQDLDTVIMKTFRSLGPAFLRWMRVQIPQKTGYISTPDYMDYIPKDSTMSSLSLIECEENTRVIKQPHTIYNSCKLLLRLTGRKRFTELLDSRNY